MSDEQTIFTPEEAIEYLRKKRGLVYSVASLRMRRYRGQVKSQNIKKRTTLWTKEELDAIEPTSWTKRVPIEKDSDNDTSICV